MEDRHSDPVAERRDEVLKRMLNTPPKPHKAKEKKRREPRLATVPSLGLMEDYGRLVRGEADSEPVGDPDAGILGVEVLGIARDQQGSARGGRGPDDGVGQPYAILTPQLHGPLRHRLIQCDALEAVQEETSLVPSFRRGADHHLHPGHDADGAVVVKIQLPPGLFDAVQVIDQDVGVEDRLHHSRRIRS